MAQVIVSPSADADLEQILADLGAHAGYRVAAKYNESFERLYGDLAHFPESGSPRPKLGTNIRIGVVFPYVVIYKRYEGDGVVRVLRIVHGARRITGGMLRGLS